MGTREELSMTAKSTTPVPATASVWMFTKAHNPYDTESGCTYRMQRSTSLSVLPEDTLHMSLAGHVSFMPYPTQEFHIAPPVVTKDQMTRVFLGQLPYQVTDMQLEWLCYTFGCGANVYFPERIVKKDHHHSSPGSKNAAKVPTGCIHAYVETSQVEGLMRGLHKRVFVDDTGVWYAQTPEEMASLDEYCHNLKVDKRLRFQNRPYDSIVVQFATSTFVPPPPTYNSTFPRTGKSGSRNSTASSRSLPTDGTATPPPPPYADACCSTTVLVDGSSLSSMSPPPMKAAPVTYRPTQQQAQSTGKGRGTVEMER